MAILKSCCCLNNVRTGSFACGVYSLMYALINSGIVGYNIPTIKLLKSMNMTSSNIEIAEGWNYTSLAVYVIFFITAIILIVGVHKDARHLLVPWLVTIALILCLDTSAIIFECTTFGLIEVNIIQMVIWLGLSLLNIYCILCVVSQYQELKAGRGRVADYRRQRASRGMLYHPGIQHVQQVHITQAPIVMTYEDRFVTASGYSIPVIRQATKVVYNPPDYNTCSQYSNCCTSEVSATEGAVGPSPSTEPLVTNGNVVISPNTPLPPVDGETEQSNALLLPGKDEPPPYQP